MYPTRHFVGLTSDVVRRLETHNSGGSVHTAAKRPWQLVAAIEFSNVEGAVKFERYLKSGTSSSRGVGPLPTLAPPRLDAVAVRIPTLVLMSPAKDAWGHERETTDEHDNTLPLRGWMERAVVATESRTNASALKERAADAKCSKARQERARADARYQHEDPDQRRGGPMTLCHHFTGTL